MKISVITVCRNSAETIRQTIQSVLSQNYDNLEYILIDGGSTDGTLDIIHQYEDRIAVIVSEPDQGIYDAMNKGLARMTGEVFAFLNSDDWYAPDTIQKVTKYFEDSQADIVSGQIYLYSAGISRKLVLEKTCEEDIYFKIIYPHPALFARREVYCKVGGFDTSYQIASDTDWIMRAWASGARILRAEDYFTYFRDGGLSARKRYTALKEQYKAALSCAKDTNRELSDKITKYYTALLEAVLQEEGLKRVLGGDLENTRAIFDTSADYYIWGAGQRGKICLEIFQKLALPLAGFIDTNRTQEFFYGYPVFLPDEIDVRHFICITPKGHEQEIMGQLAAMGMHRSRYFTYSWMMNQLVQAGFHTS